VDGVIMEAGARRVARAGAPRGEGGDEETLRPAALAQARTTLLLARAVCTALERLLEGLGTGNTGALRRSAQELQERRRALAGALLDAQELADRVVDLIGG
jgi:hypothetical protein